MNRRRLMYPAILLTSFFVPCCTHCSVRAIARILHGLPSPGCPADRFKEGGSAAGGFWGRYQGCDFQEVMAAVEEELVRELVLPKSQIYRLHMYGRSVLYVFIAPPRISGLIIPPLVFPFACLSHARPRRPNLRRNGRLLSTATRP